MGPFADVPKQIIHEGNEQKITKNTFSVVHPKADGPKVLVQSLHEVQLLLTQNYNLKAIPFN